MLLINECAQVNKKQSLKIEVLHLKCADMVITSPESQTLRVKYSKVRHESYIEIKIRVK